MRRFALVVALSVISLPAFAQYRYTPYRYAPPPPDQYAPAAVQPSFDCSRATISIERAICADPGLSALDARVGQLYQKALTIAPDRDHVISNQRSWIAARNADCGKSSPNRLYECIEKSERTRANIFAAAIAEQQNKAKQEQIALEDAGYDRIQIDDFILDSKTLIASEKKIVIAGFYKKLGGIEELYPNMQAAITDSQSAGMIYLLSDNADRDLRAYFLRCGRNQYAPCPVRVRGYASTCDLSIGALSASKPCLIVESGTPQG